MSETKSKPLGFLKDNLGDNSSKRLMSAIFAGFAIAIAIAGVVLKACGKDVESLVRYIIITFLGMSATFQGFTLPEVLMHK